MNTWKVLPFKEFLTVMRTYPNKLTHSHQIIEEVLILNYNDFSDGKIEPESTIFQEFLPDKNSEDDEFRVRTDYYERLQIANR